MGAIVGIHHLDGKPVDSNDLQRMLNTLVHRGSDGSGFWCQKEIGLGSQMMWTSPESLHEKLPLIKNNIAITADARIDNRAELISALGWGGGSDSVITDSEIILGAYEKWGELCPEKLIGDFAFIIWDINKRILFCARDPFGVRPFYFYQKKDLFVFASEIKALFEVSEIPRQLNELRIGYHLVPTVEDKAITFYKDVQRLLPGHSMVLKSKSVQMHAFWSLDRTWELSLPSDDDYAQAFREIFTEAVNCRLRSAYPVGSTLSGGLDSSAVTCVARNLLVQNEQAPLHTFSMVFDKTLECDERPYIDAVLKQGRVQSHKVLGDSLNPLADLEQVFWSIDEPFSSPTLYFYRSLCLAAREQGVRVLLDGLDGDTAVQHGDSYLAELARAGQWVNFAAEAKAISKHENLPSVSSLVQQYGLPYLNELSQAGEWGKFVKEAANFASQFGKKRRDVYWYCGVKPRIISPLQRLWRRLFKHDEVGWINSNLIHEAFAKRISLNERMNALNVKQVVTPRTAREEHYSVLTSGLMPYAFELANKVSSAAGIECRHPFADTRLVEFCLALPPQQKLHQGWVRMIVRRALSNVLPEKVTWRGGKTVNSAAVTAALDEVQTTLQETIMKKSQPLCEYVNMTVLLEIYQRYLLKRDSHDELLIWQAVILAMWLRYTGFDGQKGH